MTIANWVEVYPTGDMMAQDVRPPNLNEVQRKEPSGQER